MTSILILPPEMSAQSYDSVRETLPSLGSHG
jgi:hypothetical protein